VRDGAHVRLVDAHAEGVGRDDDLGGAGHERVLALRARLRAHPGVVGDGGDALGGDPLRELVCVLARPRVDDRGARALVGEHVHERGPLARERALAFDADDVEGEVRAVEARSHGDGVAQTQPRGYLLCDARRRGCGRGHHGRAAQRLDDLAQAQVVGPEVVSPLGDAVRLVDDEQRDNAARERGAERRGGKALGRGEDEARGARFDVAQRLLVVRGGHRRGEHRRAHAGAPKALRLVGHERDQRADDDD